VPTVRRSHRVSKEHDRIPLRLIVLLIVSGGMAVLAWRLPAMGTPVTLAVAVYLALDAKVARR